MSESQAPGVIVEVKTIFGIVASFLLASFAGWKMYFRHRLSKIDEFGKELKEHVEKEESKFKDFESKLDDVHKMVLEIWQHLAKSK